MFRDTGPVPESAVNSGAASRLNSDEDDESDDEEDDDETEDKDAESKPETEAPKPFRPFFIDESSTKTEFDTKKEEKDEQSEQKPKEETEADDNKGDAVTENGVDNKEEERNESEEKPAVVTNSENGTVRTIEQNIIYKH